ncbi:hypothetical protein [Terasakiella pusilla]|uniref:hypothetical protein n=1 Tax=Terasakiella pusilla TaxID=64973 RepID=UPI003AA8CE5B
MSIYSYRTNRASGFGARAVQSDSKNTQTEDFSGNANPRTGSQGGLSSSDLNNEGKGTVGGGVGRSNGTGVSGGVDFGGVASNIGTSLAIGALGLANPALGMAAALGRGLSNSLSMDTSDFGIGGKHGPVGFAGPVSTPSRGFSGPSDLGIGPDPVDVALGLVGATQVGADTDPSTLDPMSPNSAASQGPSSTGIGGGVGAAVAASNAGRAGAANNAGNTDQRVICTELVRQGCMSKVDQLRDLRFTQKYLTTTHIRGYHIWAIPTVRLMRRSNRWSAIWRFIAQHRANEISYQMGDRITPDFMGKVIRLIFEPFCFLVGLLAPGKKVLDVRTIHERIEK